MFYTEQDDLLLQSWTSFFEFGPEYLVIFRFTDTIFNW